LKFQRLNFIIFKQVYIEPEVEEYYQDEEPYDRNVKKKRLSLVTTINKSLFLKNVYLDEPPVRNYNKEDYNDISSKVKSIRPNYQPGGGDVEVRNYI
jgi:hypothetical protein